MYGRLAGYEDTNDAERLRVDPSLRRIVGERAKDRFAASTSEMSRFETEILATDENMKNLTNLCGQWVDQVDDRIPMKQLILDMDSSVSPTHGQNEVRLQLFALAYNLGNFLRRLALPRKIKHWTLTTLREKLIKIGAKVIRHARYITFQLAEVAITRKLFEAILQKIERLRLLPETG